MVLKICILTTQQSWLFSELPKLTATLRDMGHEIQVTSDAESVAESDLTFLLSYWGIVPTRILERSRNNLVVHESALPLGRGWSPVTWQVLEGKNRIPVCLIEAAERFDSGPVYLTDFMTLRGDELLKEIRNEQARVTFDLCRKFVSQYPQILSRSSPQHGEETTYPRRGPADSKLDAHRTIAEQFAVLRVVDNDAYPAFFELNGINYKLQIEKLPQDSKDDRHN